MTARTSAVSSSSDTDATPPAGGGRPTGFDTSLLERLDASVVGRRRELESVVAALAARRHLLLEGPPGTGKSTVLRAVAREAGRGFEFVEGNAELTPARLVGSFDPAAVLSEGYVPEVFVDGPLVAALREGAILYLEELNRVPEETLNVLITVMSEGEIHVPRLGRIVADPEFRLVAAMNPFDAVGTARIASAVYDRCCRLSMGYQSEAEERRIVEGGSGATTPEQAAAAAPNELVASSVAMVRASRDHPDLRSGSSVRGAIDHTMLCMELGSLRGLDPMDPGVTLDAAKLALSGRLRLREGITRDPEDVVEELWRTHFGPPEDDAHGPAEGSDPGKV
ncbi:MAG: MoxR family ATPase [Microthrixaceae bacterium]|nr:MoxR family ATPase [Microthrixaceae bacterium]